jgi:hypothetical protein
MQDWANQLGGLQAYRLPAADLNPHAQGSSPKSGSKRQWAGGTVPVGSELTHAGLAAGLPGGEFSQRLAEIVGKLHVF